MLKKVLAVILVLLLLIGFGAWGRVFAQAKFPDVPTSYWAYKEIGKLVELGIVKGYPDGTFKPENSVTRAEFATMVVLAKKLTLVSPATPTFKDVPTSHWAFKYVETAVKAGYLKGYPDGTFGPSKNITRQEIAAVMVNVLGLTSEAAKITEPVCFANDENKIAKWAVGVMTVAVRPKVQVLKWDKSRNIRPTANGTRAECAFGVYQILYPPTTNTKKNMSIVNEEGPESFMTLTSDSAYTAMAVSFLHSGLIGAHPDGTMYPEMAVAVPSEANGLLKIDRANGTMEVTYKLRKGIKWWDGSEVTADDIITSYKMFMAPEVSVVSRWPQDEITKIEKIDNYTVRATYKIMNIYCLLGWSIYPHKIFGTLVETNPAAINAHEFNLKPMYAGPYKIKEYVEAQYIIYEKNKNWFGGEPVLDTITVRFIQDTNTILANLLTGTIDMGQQVLLIDQAQLFEKRMGKDFNVYYVPGTGGGIMQINHQTVWFKDKRVRQAFMYAIDRAEVTRRGGVGLQPYRSPLPPGSRDWIPVLDRYNWTDKNVEIANKLLDEAGWKMGADGIRILPDGTKAILKIPYAIGARFREREVTTMQPMLMKIGIKIEHAPMDFNALLDSEDKGTFIITLHGIMFDIIDQSAAINQFHSKFIPSEENGWSGQNVVRYSNPEMDKEIDFVTSEIDPVLCSPHYKKIQEIFAEDIPTIYLENRQYPDIVRKGFVGYDFPVGGTIYVSWNCPWWYWGIN